MSETLRVVDPECYKCRHLFTHEELLDMGGPLLCNECRRTTENDAALGAAVRAALAQWEVDPLRYAERLEAQFRDIGGDVFRAIAGALEAEGKEAGE